MRFFRKCGLINCKQVVLLLIGYQLLLIRDNIVCYSYVTKVTMGIYWTKNTS